MEETRGLRARLQSIDETLTAPLALPAGRPAPVALALAHSGDGPIWAMLLAAAWFFGDQAWKTRAIVAAGGLLLAEFVVIGIKSLIRRQRPPGESGRIYRKADPFSFPSGHAARAAMLCILAWQLGPVQALIAIAAWSPFMVISRIALRLHYVFDVLAGIVLGGLLTALVLWVAPMVLNRP